MLEDNPFFEYNLKYLKFFGVIIETGYVKYFLLLSSGIMNLAQWYYLFDHKDQVLMEDVLMAIGLLFWLFRCTPIIYSPKNLKNYMCDINVVYNEIMSEEEFNNEGEDATEMLKEAASIVTKFSKLTFKLIVFAIFGKYIPQYFIEGRPLYVRVSAPGIDATKTPYIGIFFVIGSGFNLLALFIVIPLYNLSASFIIFIRTSYKVLQNRIEKSLHNADLTRIAKIIEFHCRLIQLTRDLEKLFTYSVFLEMMTFGGLICFSLSNRNQNEIMFERLFAIIYALICLALLFCPCWLANFISEEHDRISEVAYGIPWYNSSAEVKRCVFFLVMRSRIPLEMHAGKIYPMSLEMFAGFIKVLYTYINIIRNVFK